MLRVNLLPPEYRKSDGTPIARFLTVIAGVFLTATMLGTWGYVHFGMLDEVQNRRIEMEKHLDNLTKQAERSQALLAEFQEYQRRRETIEGIGRQRVLWSKKLDELADQFHNKGDASKHLVWITSLRTEGSQSPASGGALVFDGYSGGEEIKRQSDFHKQLQESEFFQDFQSISPPGGEKTGFRDERVPDVAWKFSWRLDLKTPGWKHQQ